MSDPRIEALETALIWLTKRHFDGCIEPAQERAEFRAHMRSMSEALMDAGLAGNNDRALRGIELAGAIDALADAIAGA